MPSRLFLTTLLICLSPFAQAASRACQAEAQFIARVTRVEVVDQKRCKVFLTEPSHFAESMVCPLSWSLLANKGLTLERRSERGCPVQPGQDISGVAVLPVDGNDILLD